MLPDTVRRFITIPLNLHKTMKQEAARLGIGVSDAYVRAAENWLQSGGAIPSEFGQLTDIERDVLAAVLEYIRRTDIDPRDPTTVLGSLLELGRRYRSRQKTPKAPGEP